MRAECETCHPISPTDADNSSAAAATVWTVPFEVSAAAATDVAASVERRAVPFRESNGLLEMSERGGDIIQDPSHLALECSS